MKKIFTVLSIIFCFSSMAEAALFNPGDSETISFSSLPFLGTTDNNNQTVINFGTNRSLYNPGGHYRFDVYENRTDTVPLYSQMFDVNTVGWVFMTSPRLVIDNSGNQIGVIPTPPLWADTEGRAVVTMLDGTMTMDSLQVQVITGGQLYEQTFDITSVTPTATPIPAAAWLFGSGLFGLFGIRRRTRVPPGVPSC